MDDNEILEYLKKVFKDDPQIRDYNNKNNTGIKEKIEKIEKDNEKDNEKHIAIISSIFGVKKPFNKENDESYKDWYNSLVDDINKFDIGIPKDMIKKIKE